MTGDDADVPGMMEELRSKILAHAFSTPDELRSRMAAWSDTHTGTAITLGELRFRLERAAMMEVAVAAAIVQRISCGDDDRELRDLLRAALEHAFNSLSYAAGLEEASLEEPGRGTGD